MYIAIELDDDGSINDEGFLRDTPKKAWDCVEDTFSAPDTIICEVRPVFKVVVPKARVKIVPIES